MDTEAFNFDHTPAADYACAFEYGDWRDKCLPYDEFKAEPIQDCSQPSKHWVTNEIQGMYINF